MTRELRISRVGFVAVKLLASHQTCFLMRFSKKWGDISFIGGHESERDGNKLSRAAYRELMEEVPNFRAAFRLELKPLTPEFCYGPVFSRSAHTDTGYEIQFFHLRFLDSPTRAIESFGPRTSNVLVPLDELRSPRNKNISQLVQVLDWAYPGGLDAIPFSWDSDLAILGEAKSKQREQLRLHLQITR